jgi:hypothetical protein
MFAKYPNASSIGIATGKISNIFVVDIDVKNGGVGEESFRQLVEQYGDITDTVEAITWSGGRHLYFVYPEQGIGCMVGVRDGIDIRGDGGYVIAPPSEVEQNKYLWEFSHHPDGIPIARAPEWLLRILAESNSNHRNKSSTISDKIPIGRRNTTLTSVGGTLRHRGASFETIKQALLAINAAQCCPPLSEDEVQNIAKSCSSYDADGAVLGDSGADDCSPLPIIHVSEIEAKPVDYQIDKILITNSVGFVSAQPGSYKTWLAWELGVSIGAGLPAFGQFNSQKGKVLAFNAEDDPKSVTRGRIEALAKAKGIDIKLLDLHLIDVPSLSIDARETQLRIIKTILEHKPNLIILDPLRNLHSLNEDKASDMSPLLGFLRNIQREHNCSILLICHDRKPTKDGSQRRASQTRGSNALEGWRDTAIYLDKHNDGVEINIYHRGAPQPKPFVFRLSAKSEHEALVWAQLEYVSADDLNYEELRNDTEKIQQILHENGEPMTREKIRNAAGIRNDRCSKVINHMLQQGTLKEIPEGRAKLIWFRELDDISGAGAERERYGN